MQRFGVIGMGRFGRRLARALTAAGAEVVAVDRDTNLVEQIRDEVTLAVRLDSTDAEALRAQGMQDLDVVLVGIGEDFESSALTVATLKDMGVKRIIARSNSDIQAKILRKVGADEVVLPEGEAAMRWAHRLMLPNLKQYVELGEGHSMVYVSAPNHFHSKTLQDLDLRNKFGVNLIAIQRTVSVQADPASPTISKSTITVPTAGTTILPEDVLILVGTDESLSHLPAD